MATTPINNAPSLQERKHYGAVPTTADDRRLDLSTTSWWSQLLFGFVDPMMTTGNQRQLGTDDLWEVQGENQTARAHATFKRHFEECNGSVVRAMVATYGRQFLMCGLATLFTSACSVFAPAVLHHVVDTFTAETLDFHNLSLWLGAFFLSKLVNAFVVAHSGFYLELVALRLVNAMKTLLFAKALRRSVYSKQDADAPDLVNLFSSDVDNVLWAAFEVNMLWVLPLQITVALYMLYNVIDVAAFAGLGVIAVSMAISYWVANAEGDAFDDIMERKDKRMKTIKEVFGSIQIVKLNGWEEKFALKIQRLRDHELQAVRRYLYWGALSICTLWSTPLFVSMASFAVYSLVLGKALTAAKVFTAMALFNAIREPLRALPEAVSSCIQAKVSIDRMQTYLAIEEVQSSNVTRHSAAERNDVAVVVKNGSFAWGKDQEPLLKDVNLTVKKGDLVVVHGIVGSGKSSLCSAILGEMDKLSGSVFVRGRVAYYSQQTWIQNMTIRENILFGKAYDEKKYQKVLDACGLLPDLAQFRAGDSTEIGQKGVNLSGGQKARLCLARACYSDADLLLLDSPLAAVDAVVQSEIFNKCFCGLLEDKTIILVTHAPDIIASEAANYKVELVNGELKGERKDQKKPRSAYMARLSPRSLKKDGDKNGESTDAMEGEVGRLVDDEEREEGRVSKDVFLKYFNALGGVKICVFLLLVQTFWQGFQIASDFWLSHWTGQKLGSYNHEETVYNMLVYALLGTGCAIMVSARALTVSTVGLRASRHLFETMAQSLLHAPLRFFDANPIGRIVNRFGDDMSAVDFRLPFSFGGVLAMFFLTVCQLATAVYAVNFLGVFIIPIVILYIKIGNYFLAPSREISRLWKVTTSPLLSHVTSSEEGTMLLRAFGPEYVRYAIDENCARIDANSQVWFAETAIRQWFQLRMQLLGCGVVIIVVSALVYLHDILSPGIIGLAFTYALSVEGGMAEVVENWSRLEVTMVSPERILEYASIPPEGNDKMVVVEPPSQWPSQGTITYEDVVFSYKPGAPSVLKGLSFSIKNNEKIGIVGRTGAGKSSLTMALFRINELESGRILIDGKDISTMPLQSLRSRMSIIPQAPVLFKGPLRGYMDPFNEYTDAEIWEAFEKVEMKEQISALEGQLSYELSENGENFSVGERQMLCMARAMLTKSRIVVMDEATASIDHATEKKLQHMINRDFQQVTVLTIAHRLATVLDSDRIMVLSDGRVVEFDSPLKLIENDKGMFYELCKEGGYLAQLQAKAGATQQQQQN
ncbi:hypothetical protein PINS_up006856 [Pythium insidiosum]|nr:hypothetical protein PINS_up006856 [Pythium insidiosum]